jgi:transposase
MALYCGIDLHANNSVVVVQEDREHVVDKRRLPNDIVAIVEALRRFESELMGCVVESTFNWYWLVDGLQDAGFTVHLANTAAIKQYEGIKFGNDLSDARYLAELLRLDILPTGYIYPREQRAVRDLLRRRLLLVRQKTAQTLSLQGMVNRHCAERLSANDIAQLEPERLDELLDDVTAVGAQITLLGIRWLDRASELLVREALKRFKEDPAYRVLQTIPGVGVVLGTTIGLETGSIERFRGAGNYASYARCVASTKLTNGKRKGEGNRRNGNKYLAWAFMEAAHFATIWSPRIKRYYEKKKSKTHLMVAKKTVAHKLARAVFHMLSKQEAFDEERAFG